MGAPVENDLGERGREPRGCGRCEKTMTCKRWTPKERADIVVEFITTDIGAAEICRKYGIPPTTFGGWRRRFTDAGRKELAGTGGDGGGDPAKAMAREIESLKIVAGEQAMALAVMKEAWNAQRSERRQSDGGGGGGAEVGSRRTGGQEGRAPDREPCAPNQPRRRADLEHQKGPR